MTDADNSSTLWGIHAGRTGDAETLFLVHGYIAMGWKEMGGLVELPDDREAFRKKVAATYPGEPAGAINNFTGQLYRFVHVMKIGDYVAYRPLTANNGTAYVFLGRVAGPYVYNPFLDKNYPDVRRVEWLRSVPIRRFSEGALHELGAQMTLFRIDNHAAEFLGIIEESK
jgi:restriction system protein